MGKKMRTFLMILPAVLLIVLFLLVPVLRIILPSFADEGGFTLSRYAAFLSDPFYLNIVWRTLRLSLATCLLCAVLAIPTSYYIAKLPVRKKGLMLALATFPLLTNTVVRGFAWITILGKQGVLNKALLALGMIEKPLKLLYTEKAILFGMTYLFLPVMITSLVGVMENIDDEIQEAAMSLGASRFTAFFRIVIPLSVPGLIVGGVLVFAGASSAYTTAAMLGGSNNLMLSTLIYQQAFSLNDWDSAAVIATVMILISCLLVSVMNKLAQRLNKLES